MGAVGPSNSRAPPTSSFCAEETVRFVYTFCAKSLACNKSLSSFPLFSVFCDGWGQQWSDPSPDPRRLVKAPSRATLPCGEGCVTHGGGVCLEAHTSGQKPSGRMRHPGGRGCLLVLDLGNDLFAPPTVRHRPASTTPSAPSRQHHPGARSAAPPHLRRGVCWLAPLLIQSLP
jgi:hypothetical protein